MLAKNLHKAKEKEKSIYSSSSAANGSRTAAVGTQNAPQNNVRNAEQSTPRAQSNTLQKIKREKTPSELGEEVIRSMLKEDTMAERQRQAAAGSTAQHDSGAAGTKAAGNRKTAQYGDAAGQFGGSALYSSPSVVKPAIGNQKAKPYGGAATAQYSTPAAAEPAIQKREKTPSDLGKEVVWAMLEDEGLLGPPEPEENEDPAPRTFTTGVGRSDIIGPGANAARNTAPGDGLSVAAQSDGADAGPTQAMPEWMALMFKQESDYPGLTEFTNTVGPWLGDQVKQLWDDTHIAPEMSVPLYWIERGVNGAATGLEGAYNNIIDWARAGVNADLMQQAQQAQQFAWLGEPYQRNADLIADSTQSIQEVLPEAAENLRSHRAAEYGRQIDEIYDAGGYIKLLGDIVSAGGQTVPTIAINGLTGGIGGLPYIFSSAAGNAATEARAGGASEDMAFTYGLFSGGLEAATEKMFDGIPGMKGGWLDNWLADYAETNVGRAALKAAKDSVGEGLEEFTSGMIQPYLAKMWNGDERDFWQTLRESAPDALYDGFLGMANGFGLSLPGNISNIQNARIVDAALDILDHGGTLSDAQLVQANAAMQALNNSWGKDSKWSRNANQQWTDAGNGYFTSRFSQTAAPAAAQGNRKNLSEVFFPPIFDRPAKAQNSQASASETSVRAGAATAADSNAVSSPAANSATGNNVPIEGANSSAEQQTSLPTENGAKNESLQEAQSANNSAVHVGKNTIIHNPYSSGPVPQEKTNAVYDSVPISDTALQTAERQIQEARTQGEKGFKKYLKTFYREAIGNLLNGRQVTVENILFEDRPYNVTLNTNVIEKVISDPNMSAEKLAVFSEIEDIVKNAQYLGSGDYIAHGARAKSVIRYDYFEAQATIGGNEYTVSFDVEVYPDRNNYRTHRVINNLELTPKN